MQDHKDSLAVDFQAVLQQRLSRRGLLKGSLAAASTSYLGVGGLAASSSSDAQAAGPRLRLNFNTVAKGLDDLVRLPAGYSYKMLLARGDPIAAGIPA
ncbi:MAG: hypothetical protein ACOVN8_04550 [Burkholderiaceae bacterium]